MTRPDRTDATLQEASRAVDYDLSMMGCTLEQMLQRNTTIESPRIEQLVANALHHSFLLATRNLCTFLFSYRPRSNDIIAEDFFDAPDDWKKLRPASLPEFEKGSLAKMISQRLLHLTYTRAGNTKPVWGNLRIAWELLKSLKVFVANVSPDRLSEALVEDTATLLVVLQHYVDECESVDAAESAELFMLYAKKDFWRNPRRIDSESDEETC